MAGAGEKGGCREPPETAAHDYYPGGYTPAHGYAPSESAPTSSTPAKVPAT